MLNVVFDAMTAGSLRMTIDPDTNERIAKENIICLEWHMDIGYLEEGISSQYRMELPDRFILDGCFTETPETDFTDTGKTSLGNWGTLKDRLQSRDSVRVWYSNAPHELCGFYHLCTLLQNYDTSVFAIKAPAAQSSQKGWHYSSGWGSFPQDSLGEYFALSRKLDKKETRLYASRWETLVQENAPLRAVFSGVVRSVDEDYYDQFIEQQIPAEPIKEALLVENTLASNPLGVYSFWLELRIQKMVDNGKLVIVDAPDNLKTHRILQKS